MQQDLLNASVGLRDSAFQKQEFPAIPNPSFCVYVGPVPLWPSWPQWVVSWRETEAWRLAPCAEAAG